MSLLKSQAKIANPLFLQLLCPIQVPNEWMPIHIGGDHLFYLVYSIKTLTSSKITLTDAPNYLGIPWFSQTDTKWTITVIITRVSAGSLLAVHHWNQTQLNMSSGHVKSAHQVFLCLGKKKILFRMKHWNRAKYSNVSKPMPLSFNKKFYSNDQVAFLFTFVPIPHEVTSNGENVLMMIMLHGSFLWNLLWDFE